MAQIVELPNGDTVEFPDEMGADAISSAISQSFPEFSPQPSGRTAGDVISDAGTMLHKGAVGFNQALIGVGDILTTGRVGKAVEDAGYDAEARQKQLETQYSPETQEARRKTREAEGFVDTLVAGVQNPSSIITTAGESLPQMIGGAGVARGIIASGAKVAPYLAGAIGEGVMGAGSAAEGIREESADGTLTGKQSLVAAASGAGTAAFGALGGKLAQKFGWADIDTILAGGGTQAAMAGAAKKGFIRQVVESGISEGVFEELPQSIQEQMWQNFATDKPLTDGVGNAAALGMLSGAAMGGVGGGYNAVIGKQSPPTPAADLSTLSREIKGSPEADAIVGNFSNEMDAAIDDDALTEALKQAQGAETGDNLPPTPPPSPPTNEVMGELKINLPQQGTQDGTTPTDAAPVVGAGLINSGGINTTRSAANVDVRPEVIAGAEGVGLPAAPVAIDVPSELAPGAVRAEGEALSTEAPVAGAKPAVTPESAPKRDVLTPAPLPVQEIPLSQITLSEDVPQFKLNAGKGGVIEPLAGKYERIGTAPILLWQRNNGAMEVISGRHRFELAQRTGEKTIPSHIVKESDGFNAQDAAIADAELNIRDNQGKAKDYVQYFKATEITKEAAESRGLLARSEGKRAFSIATNGSAELIAAHRGDTISTGAAYAIALNAPNNLKLQAVGIKAAIDGKNDVAVANLIKAVSLLSGGHENLDMFGFDDSAMKQAEAMAKFVAQKQQEAGKHLQAITGAAKNPAIAKQYGIDVKDPKSLAAKIAELKAEKAAWDNWQTNPELIAQIKDGIEKLTPLSGRAALLPIQAVEEAPVEDVPFVDTQTANMFGEQPVQPELIPVSRRGEANEQNRPVETPASQEPAYTLEQQTEASLAEQESRSAGQEVLQSYTEEQIRESEGRAKHARILAEAEQRSLEREDQSKQEDATQKRNVNTVASDNFALGQSKEEVKRMAQTGVVDMFGQKAESKPAAEPTKPKAKVTPQTISTAQAESVISAAADSVKTLRKSDVGRVLDETPAPWKLSMAQYIKDNRRDLEDEVRAVMAEPAAEIKPAKTQFANNKIFTQSAVDAARARLKKKLGSLNSGIDPELLQDGMILAGAHIEAGARSFAVYSKAMIDDIGDAIKPYLRSLYESVRHYPGLNTDGMTGSADIDAIATVQEKIEPETKKAPNQGAHFAAGRADFNLGKPRVLPSYFTDKFGKNAKDWYRGWDAANVDAPIVNNSGDTLIGKNADGASIWADKRGVRHYFSTGIKIQEAVGIIPGGGIEIRNRKDEYKSVEELGIDKLGAKAQDVLTGGTENARPTLTESVPGEPAQSDTGARSSGNRAGEPLDAGLAGQGEGVDSSGAVSGGVRVPSGAGTEPTGDAEGLLPSGAARTDGTIRPASGTADTGLDHTITDADEIGSGGLTKKFRDNVAAIKILKLLDTESRPATPEERKKLARYVGFGALKAVFDQNNKQWKAQYTELRDLLNDEEYDSARASVLNAHYTSKPVVDAMFSAVRRLGFVGGRFLEPSAGSGNFFGMMPADIRKASTLHGVELDLLTSKLLKALYPKANIAVATGFQHYQVPAGYFDIAMGNPPFGSEPIVDRERSEYSGFSIHNYFIARMIDKVRDGGIVPVIVSHNFMDAINPKTREWIAKRANLVAAVRLPNTAFKDNAGTEVVTDILFFQKTATPEKSPAWVDATDVLIPAPKGGESATASVNVYFQRNKQNILGKETTAGSMYRANEYTVEPTGNLTAQLAEFVASLPENIYKSVERTINELDSADNTIPAGVKQGSYFITEKGEVKQRGQDIAGSQTSIAWVPKNDTAMARMTGMINLRDMLRTQMRMERDEKYGVKMIESHRNVLSKAYDEFFKKYGFVNSQVNSNIFMDDTEYALLQAIEFDYDKGVSKAVALRNDLEERSPSAKKADIMERRVLFPFAEQMNVTSANDALLSSLDAKGKVDLEYMERAYGKSQKEIIDELGDMLYLDPATGDHVMADEYLSGDVKTKLAVAKKASDENHAYSRNVAALEKVIPADKLPSEIYASLGAGWIPADTFKQFATEITGSSKIDLTYLAATAQWLGHINDGGDVGKMSNDFGTKDLTSFELLKLTMNGKAPEVKMKTVRDGQEVLVTDTEATEAAREKVNKIKQAWESWVWSDGVRAEKLAGLFNEKHNRTVNREYDGEHLVLHGSNPAIILRKHQKSAVWRGIQDRNLLLDHAVGAGKTFVGAAIIMEYKRLGIARKPILVVPNHLTTQWRSEFARMYPAANVLAANPEDFSKTNRQRMFSKIALGEYDAVIIGHSSLTKIGLDPTIEEGIYKEQIDEIANAIEAMKSERGDRGIVRDMEKIKANLEAKVEKLRALAGERDKVVTFDELGIDGMFIDEAHEFKNLYFTTQMQRVSGLGNPKGSGKAFDLFAKVRWLTKTYGEKVPFITATGTPVSNSLSEMFTMQRYMKYDEMKRDGLHLFDSWARMYGDVESLYEVAPSGVGYRISQRFSKFKNLPSLMAHYRTFADTVTLQDLKDQAKEAGKVFPVPKIASGKPENIVAHRSTAQRDFFGIPTVRRDEGGRVVFAMDHTTAKIEQSKEAKWILSDGHTSTSFDTKEDAELALVEKSLTPILDLDPKSLLGQFGNLAQLTRDTKGKINALSLTSLASKAGLDMRIINPNAEDFAGSKINKAVDKMMGVYQKWSKDKGTQLVFCDSSIPLSARASMATKDRRLFVLDDQGMLTHKKGTLHTVEGFEGFPFYLVRTVDRGSPSISVYDPVTGLRIKGDIANKGEAKDWVADFLSKDANRDKWYEARESKEPITAERMMEYRAENDLELAEDGSNEVSMEDIEGVSGASQFSVYDDIKAKLVARGVPENKIAFIHDYDTPAKKQALFKSVNRGDVRFLLGSTPKLGAGTNVQERLVGLHHIDAPWRPSDLEQREGRIIRQGNMLYARDPDGFEVFIGRYATEQTYDTRRWQLLEHKASGIEQLRKYSGQIEIEDVAGEAANSADMKAAASGNPLILEETKLRTEVKRLTALQKAHGDGKYAMQRKLSHERNRVSEWLPKRIADISDAIEAAAANPIPTAKGTIPLIEIDGRKITDKENAEKKIAESVTMVRTGFTKSKDIYYRGVKFTLKAGWASGLVEIESSVGTIASYGEKDAISPSGMLTRFSNYIDSLPQRKVQVQADLEQAKKDIASIEARMDEPFEDLAVLAAAQQSHGIVQRKLMKSSQIDAVPAEERAAFAAEITVRKEKLEELGYGTALKEMESDTKFSQSATPARNPFTLSGLKSAIDSAFPGVKKFSDALLGTGKFHIIGRDEIAEHLGGGTRFSKTNHTDTEFFKWTKKTNPLEGVGGDIPQHEMLSAVPNKSVARVVDNIFMSVKTLPDGRYQLTYLPNWGGNKNYFFAISSDLTDLITRSLSRLERSDKAITRAKDSAYKNSLVGKLEEKFGNVFSFAKSTQSKSEYIVHEPSGTKIRISDHNLPLHYEQVDIDLRTTQSTEEQFSEIEAYLSGESNPDIRYSKDGRILAFVRAGNAYFVHDNISATDDNVKGLLLHEIGSHALSLGRTEPEFQKILSHIELMRKMGNKKIQAARDRVPKDTPAHLILEEQAGYMLEMHPNLSASQMLIAWFREALRKLGSRFQGMQKLQWMQWAKNLSTDDIIYMATQATKSAPYFGEIGGDHLDRTGLTRFSKRQEEIPGTAQPPAQPPRQDKVDLQGGEHGNNASWDSPVPSKLDTFLQVMQNKHIDLKRVTETIKATGKQIADSVNAYLQEELFHGRSAERTKLFLEKEMTPLVEEMRMRGVKMADFEEYLWMRHAEERNLAMEERNPDRDDNKALSGIDTEAAQDYLQNLSPEKRKAYESLAKRVDAMNKGTRQVWVEYGLESPNTVQAMEDAYDNYVPLMREDMDHGHGTGQGFSVKGNATKHATGSNRAVVDILANMALARERAIVRGEKNRVAKALIGLATLNPNPEFWKVNTPPTIRTVSERTGLVEVRVDPAYKSRDNVVMARAVRNGKVVEYSVTFNEHDERAMRMALSLKNLDQDQMSEWLGSVGNVTRYFAAMNTQYNPMFGVINIIRDIGSGALNLTTTKLKGKEGRILKNVPSALRGIYNDLRNHRAGKPGTSEWSKLFEEFKAEGGQTGFRDQYKNAKDRAEAIEQALNPDWWMDTKVGKVLTAGGALNAPAGVFADKAVRPTFAWLSDYNDAMENTVRLAAYKEARDMGLSKQESASIAKNLTVNFNRKGRIGREMGSLYAFFNASVQGTARMAETLSGPRGKQIIAGGITLGVIQAVAMAMAGMDDGEPPDFVKDRNIIIPTGDGKYLSIPTPLGFNVLPVLGRSITEAFIYGKPMKRALHIGEVMLDMFNPIGTASVLQTFTPTVVDPMAAIIENKDWTGKPIAREDFNSLSPTPGHSRAKDTSTAISRGISEALNYLTGGNKYRAGMISPTPDQIDYLAVQIGGGVWRETSKIGQAAESVITGQELPSYKRPLLGKFYGDTTDQSSQGGKFYQNLKDLNELEAEIKGRKKDHIPTADIYKDNPEARLVGAANKAEQDVQELRRRRRKLIEQSASIERVKIMDMRITAKMKQLNDRVKQLESRQE